MEIAVVLYKTVWWIVNKTNIIIIKCPKNSDRLNIIFIVTSNVNKCGKIVFQIKNNNKTLFEIYSTTAPLPWLENINYQSQNIESW